jgi:predicted Zn-dependent protease
VVLKGGFGPPFFMGVGMNGDAHMTQDSKDDAGAMLPPLDAALCDRLRALFAKGQLPQFQEALSAQVDGQDPLHGVATAAGEAVGLWCLLLVTTLQWHADPVQRRAQVRSVLQCVPKRVDLDSRVRSEVGLALMLGGDLANAETVLAAATADDTASPWAWFRYGTLAGLQGNWAAARTRLETGLAADPHRAEAWANLARAHTLLGEVEAAREASLRAWALRPAFRGFARSAIEALEAQGSDALTAYRDALMRGETTADDDAAAQANRAARLALIAEHQGDTPEMLQRLAEAVRLHEADDEIRHLYIDALLSAQRYGVLGQHLRRWTDQFDSLYEHLALATCRIEAGYYDAARDGLEAIRHRTHGDPAWELAWARYQQERGDAVAARDTLQAVLDRHPQHLPAINQLADVLATLGDMARATELTQKVADINPQALIRLLDDKKDPTAEDVARLAQWRARITDRTGGAALDFALARVHDRRRDYAEAAAVLQRANTALWPELNYQPAAFTASVDQLMAQHTPEWRAAHQAGRTHRVRPVFIVGMPRSGTTLLEQIFAAHPEVYGGGELPYMARIRSLSERLTQKVYPHSVTALSTKQVGDAADYYLQLAERSLGFTESVLVDKLPHNFMHAALLCAMFPDARIIALRRDYRAIALSNYFQNFAAARGLLGYAFDLEALGQHLKDFHRLMDYWKNTLPVTQYREFHYEDLVQNPTDTIPEVLTFCGLDFTPEVMEFYRNQTTVRTASIRQVRNPLYTGSVEKWRHYADLLAPVIRIVEEGA